MLARPTTPKGERISPGTYLVGKALLRCGIHTPTHKYLAERSSMSLSTVKRALAWLQERSLLSWTRHTVRGDDWRAQTANHYHYMSAAPIDHITTRARPGADKPKWVKVERMIALETLLRLPLPAPAPLPPMLPMALPPDPGRRLTAHERAAAAIVARRQAAAAAR